MTRFEKSLQETFKWYVVRHMYAAKLTVLVAEDRDGYLYFTYSACRKGEDFRKKHGFRAVVTRALKDFRYYRTWGTSEDFFGTGCPLTRQHAAFALAIMAGDLKARRNVDDLSNRFFVAVHAANSFFKSAPDTDEEPTSSRTLDVEVQSGSSDITPNYVGRRVYKVNSDNSYIPDGAPTPYRWWAQHFGPCSVNFVVWQRGRYVLVGPLDEPDKQYWSRIDNVEFE